MTLDEIREEINSIDAEITELLCRRMKCSENIAKIKSAENKPVFVPEREKAILNKMLLYSDDYGEYLSEIYKEIMKNSRKLQEKLIASDLPKK